MRVQIVYPSAFTPPYDHALSGALGRAGADVELVTSRFLYGPVPREDGYRVTESFYLRTAQRGLLWEPGQVVERAVRDHVHDGGVDVQLVA